jgi:hypothetical protein
MAASNKDNAPEVAPEVIPEDSTALVVRQGLTEDALREVTTWDDAMRALVDAGMVSSTARDVLGVGFETTRDKDQLINRPFIIVEYSEHDGDVGRFCFVRCITKDGAKFQFTDGSTGIFAQLSGKYKRDGMVVGIVAQNGLNRSDYQVTIEGKETAGTTYYVTE